MTLRKEDIILEIFEILKAEQKPISQSDIIKKLVEKGHKYTICVGLFHPSILQPLWLEDENDFAPPMVEKTVSIASRPLYVLNKKWRGFGKNEAEKKLCGHF